MQYDVIKASSPNRMVHPMAVRALSVKRTGLYGRVAAGDNVPRDASRADRLRSCPIM